jgi:paraquat-inducible protein A
VVRASKRNSLGRTAAFSLAALLFYWPANVYPILRMDLYGAHSENTILQGALSLFEHDQPLVAVIVVLASVAIPLLKLLGLFYLVVTRRLRFRRRRIARTWIYRTVDVIGPWAWPRSATARRSTTAASRSALSSRPGSAATPPPRTWTRSSTTRTPGW